LTVTVMEDAVPPIVVHDAVHAVIGLLLAVSVDADKLTDPGEDVATNRTGLPVSPDDVASSVSLPTI